MVLVESKKFQDKFQRLVLPSIICSTFSDQRYQTFLLSVKSGKQENGKMSPNTFCLFNEPDVSDETIGSFWAWYSEHGLRWCKASAFDANQNTTHDALKTAACDKNDAELIVRLSMVALMLYGSQSQQEVRLHHWAEFRTVFFSTPELAACDWRKIVCIIKTTRSGLPPDGATSGWLPNSRFARLSRLLKENTFMLLNLVLHRTRSKSLFNFDLILKLRIKMIFTGLFIGECVWSQRQLR